MPTTSAPICRHCQISMVTGFVVDHTHGGATTSHWGSGQAQKSFWVGLKIDEKKLIPVGTYRCDGCGYLESFARAEFVAK